jgi:hypothetical protein
MNNLRYLKRLLEAASSIRSCQSSLRCPTHQTPAARSAPVSLLELVLRPYQFSTQASAAEAPSSAENAAAIAAPAAPTEPHRRRSAQEYLDMAKRLGSSNRATHIMDLLEEMSLEGVHPSREFFSVALHLAAVTSRVPLDHALHYWIEMRRMGHLPDVRSIILL